jgi:hypothetical protein
MWHHTETFWWPFFGWDIFWTFKPMNTPETMLNIYLDIITRYPQVWVIEIMAILLLIGFAYRYQLHRWSMLKHFILTGNILTLHPRHLQRVASDGVITYNQ